MTEEQFSQTVVDNYKDLLHLVGEYHPSNERKVMWDMKITAPGAERACEAIRKDIREGEYMDQRKTFEEAVHKRDWRKVYSLISDTWFGVPESTDCWQIPGFKVAVDLLDDPIEL